MKKKIFVLLAWGSTLSLSAESSTQKSYNIGEGAGYSTRDATVLSMMGWGIGLSAAIATLCALIPNNESGHAH